MYVTRKVVYDEMGDGYDVTYIIYDKENDSVRLIHLGRFYEDMPSSVNATHLDVRGYHDRS